MLNFLKIFYSGLVFYDAVSVHHFSILNISILNVSTKNPQSAPPILLFHPSIPPSMFSFAEHKFIEGLSCATHRHIHNGYFCEPADLVPDLKEPGPKPCLSSQSFCEGALPLFNMRRGTGGKEGPNCELGTRVTAIATLVSPWIQSSSQGVKDPLTVSISSAGSPLLILIPGRAPNT